MRIFNLFYLIACFLVLSACAASAEAIATREADFDWRHDWAVEEGFALSVDTEGYDFPTAIAFVPNPGPNPKDPLYFVTELRGTVKVIANDRTVHTFAEEFFQQFKPHEELPSVEGQGGLAGICLDPKHGYVFVTFTYEDENKILRNNMVRFDTTAETFASDYTSKLVFTEIFRPYKSGLAHQIGPCQVKDDLVYVSIGEGWNSAQAQQIDVLLGKIIRMTLEGEPAPNNPFYQDDDISKAANFVWAYGLRNPFGLKIVENRLFAAENGLGIDRFLEIEKGANYLWDGNDASIATNAAAVFIPSISPVQLDYYPEGSSLFPKEYERTFYMATAGKVKEPGPAPAGKIKGILMVNYGLEESRVLSVPKYLLRYQGNGYQSLVGLAFGPDGLYFAPLFPNEEGMTAILKVSHEPDNEHPFVLGLSDPAALMAEKGCLGCHSLGNKGGEVGPPLDRDALVTRVQTRLNSHEYIESVKEVDLLDSEPFINFKEARQEVLAAKGEDQIRTWIENKLQEPRFDNPHAQMPQLNLSSGEIAAITNHLLKEGKEETSRFELARLISSRFRLKHLIFAFVVGFVGSISLLGVWKGTASLFHRSHRDL